MIRVLHLITDLEPGGAERLLVDLARHRDRKTFEISVAYLRGGGTLRERLVEQGATVNRLERPTPRALRDLVRRIEADLLHTHLIRADFLGGALARKDPSLRWITTKHNTHYFRGLRYPYRWVDRRFNLRAAGILAVSDAVRAHFAGTEGLDPARIEVVRNGVTPASAAEDSVSGDLRRRVRRELGIDADPPVLVQVGSLTRQKGHGTTLQALRRLNDEGRDVWLLVVGDGPLRPMLAGRARKLGVEGRVRFLGLRDQVRLFLRAADLFVFPSLWEGLGIAILEAMDVGLAVVASRVGGIPEVVADGETGVLVPPRDPVALAQAVARVLDDRDVRTRMGEAGRARARGEFDASAMVRRYEEIYRNALGEKT